MSDLAVVLEALRKEATTWDTQGDAIATVGWTAEGLRLNYATSPGVFALIVNAYEGGVDQVTARCREGGTNMEAIAAALRLSADVYERSDVEVTEHIDGTY